MKLKSLIIICLSVIMLGLADNAEAQRRNKYQKRRKTNKRVSSYKGGSRGVGRFEPYLYMGAAANAANYFGDLAPVSKAGSTDISFTRPGFGFFAGYKFHHSLAVRAGFNWYRVAADDFSADPTSEDDVARYARNLSFRNDIKEFQLGLEVHLLPNYGGPNRRIPLNAYLFFGAAVFLHEPMAKVPDFDYQADPNGTIAAPSAGEWVKLRPLGTEGQNIGLTESYSNIGISIPVSIGATMRVPGTQFDVGLEFGVRYLFTDYIDDVSNSYADLSALEASDGALARILSDRSVEPTNFQGNTRNAGVIGTPVQGADGFYRESGVGLGSGFNGSVRGNPDNNDLIFVTQLKLTYIIGGTTRRRAKYR